MEWFDDDIYNEIYFSVQISGWLLYGSGVNMSVAVDDVDEEDIVFDQTTLLTQRVKRVSQEPRPGRCNRVLQTLLLYAAFFGLVIHNKLYIVYSDIDYVYNDWVGIP